MAVAAHASTHQSCLRPRVQQVLLGLLQQQAVMVVLQGAVLLLLRALGVQGLLLQGLPARGGQLRWARPLLAAGVGVGAGARAEVAGHPRKARELWGVMQLRVVVYCVIVYCHALKRRGLMLADVTQRLCEGCPPAACVCSGSPCPQHGTLTCLGL